MSPQISQASSALTVFPAPALEALGLTEPELAALRTQGFVSTERAANSTLTFKLRFRHGGRQRVVYLGRDAERAAKTAVALAAWQRARTQQLELRRLLHEATRLQREMRTQLWPRLVGMGLYFHGRTVRRSRLPRSDHAHSTSENCDPQF